MSLGAGRIKRIFSYPLLWFKKLGKDTFINGLIWGAILSLMINVVTIQMQENLQKQRVFEAIENEILTNSIIASIVIDENTQIIENQYPPDFFKLPAIYNDEVWRSSEAMKYIVQLDPMLQAELYSYYNPYILQMNQIAEKDTTLAEESLKGCYFNFENLSDSEQEYCLQSYYFYLNSQSDSAVDVMIYSEEILLEFHPTADRLNNPFLRLVMGSKTIGGLSGE